MIMKYLLFFVMLVVPVLAADLPELTTEQKLQVREAQLRVAAIMSQRNLLQEQWRSTEIEMRAAGEAMKHLVASLKPAGCQECTLKQDLTWHRPASPKKDK